MVEADEIVVNGFQGYAIKYNGECYHFVEEAASSEEITADPESVHANCEGCANDEPPGECVYPEWDITNWNPPVIGGKRLPIILTVTNDFTSPRDSTTVLARQVKYALDGNCSVEVGWEEVRLSQDGLKGALYAQGGHPCQWAANDQVEYRTNLNTAWQTVPASPDGWLVKVELLPSLADPAKMVWALTVKGSDLVRTAHRITGQSPAGAYIRIDTCDGEYMGAVSGVVTEGLT